MKIAIEAQRIFRLNKHGMDFVALELIRELQKLDEENEYFILVAPGEDRCLEETKNFRIIELRMPSYPLWEQIALPRAVKRINPDILHCTSNTAPIWSKVPLMVTLHDIIFLEKEVTRNKSWYQRMGRIYRRLVVPRVLSRCHKVITVSEFEKQHILRFLNLSNELLQTVYNGYNRYFYPRKDISAVREKYRLPEQYLFFLGNTDPKKNVPNVLEAYAGYLKQSKIKKALVIADMSPEILSGILRDKNCEDIVSSVLLPGYVRNDDLPFIYSGASVFLYPSLRESFGIPILEAMACGTPIITSNSSAMPEIAGSEACLIDPFRVETITNALLRYEEDCAYYQRQIAYGLERVKNFSWKKTAEDTLNIYQKIR
ncbi:glycosyltransferase family 4 protein [Coprobacter sp.]